LFNCALEKERRLGDNRNVLSEGVKTHLQSVKSADGVSGAYLRFDDPEDCLNYRRLPGSRTANDCYLLPRLSFKANVVND
jgi:hypothetical protein